MLRGYAKTPMQEEKLQKKARKAVQDMLRDDVDQNGGAIFDWIFTYYLPCEKPGLGLQVSGENGIDVYTVSVADGDPWNCQHVEGSDFYIGACEHEGDLFKSMVESELRDALDTLIEDARDGEID